MGRRDAALILALCSYVKRRVAAVEERAKRIAEVEFPQEKVAAAIDGTVVAYTGRYTRRPREPFTVLDDAGFVAWVQNRWPTEVQSVTVIRPAFLQVLAERAQEHGALVDDDGEVCDFVKLADDEAYTRTSLTTGAVDVLKPLLDAYNLASLEDIIEQEEGQ